MSRINSRRKGNRYERRIAKLMQEWSGFEFSRTPSSGGLQWKKTDNITGDIVCTDPLHKCWMSIEVKARKELEFQHLLTDKKCNIYDFWEQTKEDAKRGMKIPILFMKQNRIGSVDFYYLVLSYIDYRIIRKYLNYAEYSYMTIRSKNIVIMESAMLLDNDYHEINEEFKRIILKRCQNSPQI